MTFFLGTVSKRSPDNWDLAKQIGLWGVTSARAAAASRVVPKDQIIIWLAGRGFGAVCNVTGTCRKPKDISEAPWDGGTYQWKIVVPFEVELELQDPLWLKFNGNTQEVTGFPKGRFQSSFQSLADDKGAEIVSLMREQPRSN